MKNQINWWIFTGPESTAKSTLARQIAKQTGLPVVDEQSRLLLEEGLFNDIGETELLAIAEHQWAAEILAHAREGLPIILDTDLVTMKVWYEWANHRPCPEYWNERIASRHNVRYLLCHPDIDWEPDPLRENPDDREELLEAYKRAILELGFRFVDIKGSGEKRWQEVLKAFGIS
mgnify:CR=1 FL=1